LILGLCGIFSPTKQAITSAFNSVLSQPQTVTRYETKNIEDIHKDDYVLAYDVRTGEVTKRKVTDVFKRQADHIRYLTTIGDNNAIQTFETTDSHPFWVTTDKPDLSRVARDVVDENGVMLHHENIAVTEHGYYVEAKDLKVGDVFLGTNDELTTLTETHRKDFPEGITVYNFSVEDDHNYFVIANYEAYQNGAEPVLVHNAVNYNATRSKLQHEFKHASHFGITGNLNNTTLDAFQKAIHDHINKNITQIIEGTYRGTIHVTHYFDPTTKLNVMLDKNNSLVGAWKLTNEQINYLNKVRNVQ
jgi:hypothetical protein